MLYGDSHFERSKNGISGKSADASKSVSFFLEIQPEIGPHDRRQRQHGYAVHGPDRVCTGQGGKARPPRIFGFGRVGIAHFPDHGGWRPDVDS